MRKQLVLTEYHLKADIFSIILRPLWNGGQKLCKVIAKHSHIFYLDEKQKHSSKPPIWDIPNIVCTELVFIVSQKKLTSSAKGSRELNSFEI